jgi:hypothetical protein
MVLKFIDANGGSHSFSVQSLAPAVETVQRVDTKTAPDGTVYKRAVNPRHTNGVIFDTTDSWTTCPAGTYKLGSSDSLKTIDLEFDYVNDNLKCGFTHPKIGTYDLNWGAIYTLTGENQGCAFVAFDYGGTTYIGIATSSPSYPGQFTVGQGISANYFEDAIAEPYMPDFDYGGGAGDSGDTGGYGSGIPEGDRIGTHNELDEPSKQALLGYGMHAYIVDGMNLAALSKYLWGASPAYQTAFWSRWENYKYNPIAGIISCHRLPAQLCPSGGSATPISIAGLTLSGGDLGLDAVNGSPFLFNRVWTNTYSVPITPPKEDFTDFSNVTMGIYLPFVGELALDPSQCMGRHDHPGRVYVQYCCNALTGDCAAIVLAEDQFGYVNCVGAATGNCAEKHVITGNDNGMAQTVGGLNSIVGGLTGAAITQNPIAAVPGVVSGISQIMAAPHHTQIVGNPGGSSGWCSQWTCYVYMYYNVPIETDNYNPEIGRPSMASGVVGDYSGFNTFAVHADGIGKASDEEKREIERLCADGIII